MWLSKQTGRIQNKLLHDARAHQVLHDARAHQASSQYDHDFIISSYSGYQARPESVSVSLCVC
jgi:hypothetical protein